MPTKKKTPRALKTRLAALKKSDGFVPWRYSSELAAELCDLVQEVKASIDDPRIGAEMMLSFYETDIGVLGHCDDSSGLVGDVYRIDAQDLFVHYARKCDDKEWLVERVFNLMEADDYGVRDALLEVAPRYLPEAHLRALVARMQAAEAALPQDKRGFKWRVDIETLARAMKDGALFAEARLSYPGPLHSSACVDIAKVYLSSGDARTALEWIGRIPAGDHFRDYERDELLFKIYAALGDSEKQTECAWHLFRRSRSINGLGDLVELLGEGHRAGIIADEARIILATGGFSQTDASFLTETGYLDEAESYLVTRADIIDGELYGGLVRLAGTMQDAGKPLAATVIYRALLDSILARARSKIYGHGVRYLKILDRLAGTIRDWRNLPDHTAYVAGLRDKHARKSAFWGRYRP